MRGCWKALDHAQAVRDMRRDTESCVANHVLAADDNRRTSFKKRSGLPAAAEIHLVSMELQYL